MNISETLQEISIADAFALRLAELKRIDEESQRKTNETLKRIRKLISETEEICQDLERLESEEC